MVIEGATAPDILTTPGDWATEVERVPSLHLVDEMLRGTPWAGTCGTRTAVYAVGDIHGRSDLLDTMFDAIAVDAAHRGVRARIVLTGDYVDKGPDSHGVVERIMAGPPRGAHELLCLRGNHDDMFRKVVAGTPGLPNWAWKLHEHAVRSYGGDSPARSALLRRHADFLASLPLTFDDGMNLFVHAGIRPGVPLGRQREEDLLWIREGFLDYEGPLPRRVVHGHTIVGDHPVATAYRVSIDTGAYRSGILTAAVFDDFDIEFLRIRGRPDREAWVREELMVAGIEGIPVSPTLRAAFELFVAGAIDEAELARRRALARCAAGGRVTARVLRSSRLT